VKRMTIVVLFLGSLALAQEGGAKAGAELTDPVEILKKADAATKEVKAVQYTGSAKGTEANETRLPTAEGKMVLAGWANNSPAKYRVELKIKRPGASDVIELGAGANGDTTFLVDHKNKKAHEDIDPAVLGGARRDVSLITMAEFVQPDAFSDEISSEKPELKGAAKVGNEDCYEVHVKYAQPNVEAVWFFSKKDFLPRRVDRMNVNREGKKAGRQLIITDLVVNPKITDDAFKLVAPPGYTKTDDFAP